MRAILRGCNPTVTLLNTKTKQEKNLTSACLELHKCLRSTGFVNDMSHEGKFVFSWFSLNFPFSAHFAYNFLQLRYFRM